MWTLAMVVFVASILAPLLKLLALLYVLLPLHFGRRPWRMAQVFRWIETLHPWAMTEVYLLGVDVYKRQPGNPNAVLRTARIAASGSAAIRCSASSRSRWAVSC